MFSIIFSQIDLVIGEPYFSFSHLPWHNMFFWYSLNSLFAFDLNNGVTESKQPLSPAFAMPTKATVWAVPVMYRDLWKIRAPVVSTEGFDLGPFDKIIMVRLLD